MYLEISARRSGKTYRLIEAVQKRLDLGENCHVIYPTRAMAEAVLPAHFWTYPNFCAHSLDWENSPAYNPVYWKNWYWFYDEFDYGREYPLSIKPNGYYVTTPGKIRESEDIIDWYDGVKTDYFLDVLSRNNWSYKAYACPSLAEKSILKKDMAREDYAKDFGHQIFK